MRLSIIVAIATDNAIGKNNDLLWHLPADLKRFKETTTGHTIVMGRNTFFSLPKGALPNRRNIVITKTQTSLPGAECFPSLDEALDTLKREKKEQEEVFIIGGAQLYKSALPLVDKLYLTRVDATFPEADAFFPEINFAEWTAVHSEHFDVDEHNAYASTLTIYKRIS